jgi:hypothetical protein
MSVSREMCLERSRFDKRASTQSSPRREEIREILANLQKPPNATGVTSQGVHGKALVIAGALMVVNNVNLPASD